MIHERKYDPTQLSKPFGVTPKEVDRAEENVTIVVRPQAAGTHGVFAVDVSNGRPIGIWYEVDAKGEIPRAITSLQRDLDKFYGRGGQMSDRGRHRQKASAVERFESALLVERVATRFAMEFDTPEALRKYLKDHPDADRSNHTVKKETGGKSVGDLKSWKRRTIKMHKDLGAVSKELEDAQGAAVEPAVTKAKKLIGEVKKIVEQRIKDIGSERADLKKEMDAAGLTKHELYDSYNTLSVNSQKLLSGIGKSDDVPELERDLGRAVRWLENNGLHK